MSRFRIGIGLLIGLLILGIAVQIGTRRMQEPVAAALKRAQISAMAGDWENADAMAATAAQRWQDGWRRAAALADHEPMEDIDGMMAQLSVFAAGREEWEFAALCAELSRRVEAMADAHAFHWWNIL